jgi:environmental stress-induced protein Ves
MRGIPVISKIEASNYKTLPWKNGKGETVELAINEGGTLENFDWRISIAGVSEDGVFSDFSGYQRNLVLVKGAGIELDHQDAPSVLLDQPLKAARFDGADQTTGKLVEGAINDFNLITRHSAISETLETYPGKKQLTVRMKRNELAFCYSLSSDLTATQHDHTLVVKQADLMKIDAHKDLDEITISGSDLIFIKLTPKD